MASHVRTERHTAARNTILLWLGGVILFAGILILLTYHALRDSSLYANTMTPLMTEKDQVRPASSLKTVQVRPKTPAETDAAADIARAHSSAVAAAKSDVAPAADAPTAEVPSEAPAAGATDPAQAPAAAQ